MDMPTAIRAVTERRDLAADDMRAVMQAIMTGPRHAGADRRFPGRPAAEGRDRREIAAAAEVDARARHPGRDRRPREHLGVPCGTGRRRLPYL